MYNAVFVQSVPSVMINFV